MTLEAKGQWYRQQAACERVDLLIKIDWYNLDLVYQAARRAAHWALCARSTEDIDRLMRNASEHAEQRKNGDT